MNISTSNSVPSCAAGLVLVTSLVGALGPSAGCGGEPNTGRFEIGDIRSRPDRVDECLETAFPLEPTFFAARDRIDSVGLFMQSLARVGQDADLVYIEVLAAKQARNNPGSTFAFGHPPADDAKVRAELAVDESCPDVNTSLAIQGRVRFDSFETRAGGRMVGELVEGSVVDARVGKTVAGSISGDWDFAVEVSSPHRSFPTYEDEYPHSP